MRRLGDAMDDWSADADPSVDDGTPTIQQLHALAQAIVAQRQQVDGVLSQVADADSSVDLDALTTASQQLAGLVQQFAAMRAAINASNPYALNAADQAILDIGNWAQGVVNALPATLAAIPNAVLDALGSVAATAGQQTLKGLLPWLAVGGAVLFFLLQAEKSRTVRKYVA